MSKTFATSVPQWVLAGSLVLAAIPAATASEATALRARYAALESRLRNSPFDQPLHLESLQLGDALKGDVYAVIMHPMATIRRSFADAEQWCDVLILHLNVKQCRASDGDGPRRILLNIGRKFEQDLEDTQDIEFSFAASTRVRDYLSLRMQAAEGPFGTSNYALLLEVVSLDSKRSFLHLSYSYDHGKAARMAMDGYLGTLGRKRVGFSTTGQTADGRPIHVGGLRGAIERNAMRYYLAIGAYLDTASLPSDQREDRRLRAWFAATERYPLQLRELEEAEYLRMKRNELARQHAGEAG